MTIKNLLLQFLVNHEWPFMVIYLIKVVPVGTVL